MVVRVTLRGFIGGYSGQQKDGSLELGRVCAIRHEHFGVVVGPVGRCGDALFVGQLERLDAAHNLVHVAADAGGVVERQHELVLGVDDKDGANRQRQGLFVRSSRVQHAKRRADGSIGIADDRELDFDLVLAVRDHIREPFIVRLDGVNRQGSHDAIHGHESVVLEGQAANLRGANRSKVGGVAKENRPLVEVSRAKKLVSLDQQLAMVASNVCSSEHATYLALLPLVERIPVSLRCIRREIGNDVAETEATISRFLGV